MAEKKEVTETQSVLSLDLGTAVRKLMRAIGRKVGKLAGEKVVTLDIDSSSIRLMEIRGGVVRRWADASLEPGNGEEEEASNELALGMVVRQLMASSGIRASKVIVSLSGLYSVSRILSESSLPPAPTTEGAVLEMANAIMPLSEDKRYLFWQAVGASEGERLFLTIGVARDVMDNEVRALKAVGISPRVVELKAMALIRTVNKEQALILNIEPSSFDVIMVVNSVPEIMHTVAWRQDDLTVEEAAEHLAVTLEMTVDFYNSRHLEKPLDPATPLFITGQMSINLDLVEKLQAGLGYPIEPLAPPLEYPAYLPISQYAVNIGLALRKTSLSPDNGESGLLPLDINLLPDIYRPWRPNARQIYLVVIILASLAVMFPLFQVAGEAMAETSSLQVKFNVLNTQLELKKIEIQKREPLQKAIGEFHTIVDRKGSITEDAMVIIGEAEKLGVTVKTAEHEGDSIVVSCTAEDYLTFRQYLTALEASGRFATPIPPPEGYPYTTGGTIKLEPQAVE
ncbi:hypothetical protein ES703_98457 [subsurface metagenome]